jgi:hypothetical protein
MGLRKTEGRLMGTSDSILTLCSAEAEGPLAFIVGGEFPYPIAIPPRASLTLAHTHRTL